MTVSVESLPPELLEYILSFLDPIDVSAFAQTKRSFNTQVNHSPDLSLWRALYLSQSFDDPRFCVTPLGDPLPTPFDWRVELQRIVRARTIILDPSKCKKEERIRVLETLINLVGHIPPSPSVFSDALSENLLWVAAMLRGGALLDVHRPGNNGSEPAWSDISTTEYQLLSRLHTYFGLTPSDARKLSRVQSLSYVYDMRNYRYENDFGPWMSDGSGRVNWEHVRALHHTVSMHLVQVQEEEEFEYAIFPMSLSFCQPLLGTGVDLGQERDWAGVEGLWHCAFCFIDHRELLLYNNFNRGGDEPLDDSLFQNPEFREVFRIVPVEFYIISTEPDPDHPTRPKLHIAGEMGDNEHVTVGSISLTPDDQIKWHFVSEEQGQPVWSGEGVQIGSVQSPFGVLGAWTTVMHDPYDPVGPLWLHKVIDQGLPARPSD